MAEDNCLGFDFDTVADRFGFRACSSLDQSIYRII